MKRKYTLVAALAMVALLGVGMVSAFGSGNGFMSGLTDDERAEMQDQKEAIRAAVENEEYAEWKSLMEDRIAEMSESLNEENFNELVARHQERAEFREAMEEAREAGDFSRMQELKEEFGVERNGFGGMKGQGSGRMQGQGQGSCLE